MHVVGNITAHVQALSIPVCVFVCVCVCVREREREERGERKREGGREFTHIDQDGALSEQTQQEAAC